jgi:hypothetical protein
MDIKDIMTDGKIDGQKMTDFVENSWACIYEDLDTFADAINAYLDGLKPQETPITPERLEAAGFEYHAPGIYVLKNGNEYLVHHNVKGVAVEGDFSLLKYPYISTMEQLSALYQFMTGQPLTWVTPYERTVKELEAMGFRYDPQWDKYKKIIGGIDLAVNIENFCVLFCHPFSKIPVRTAVRTFDQLEKLVGALKGE